MRFDVIYWWSGGREHGQWNEVRFVGNGHPIVAELELMGRVAVFGSTTIGPPEGPPSDAKFSNLGL